MTIENGGESHAFALEHKVALEVLELRDLMYAKQRKFTVMLRKSMELRATKLARDHSSLNTRTALKLLEKESELIKPPRTIRSEEFLHAYGEASPGPYYAELKPSMTKEVVRLAIYHAGTEMESEKLYDFSVNPNDVVAEVSEGDRTLEGDELNATLGFLAAAKALYPETAGTKRA